MTASISRELPAFSGVRWDMADYVNERTLEALTGERYDSAGTAFTLRALTEVLAKTYDVKYPDLKARQILPVFSGIDPAAESYVWQQFDRQGGAKLIDSYGADLPSTEIMVQEFQTRCLSLGASYNYSIQDLRKAKMAGVPLETRKAMAARRTMEQAVEQIAFFGVAQVPATNLAAGAVSQALMFVPATPNTNDPMACYGFANFPGLVVNTGTVNWLAAATTPAQIAADWNSQSLSIINTSKGVHSPDSVVMPLSTWGQLASTPRSITFTDDTVLQYLLKVNPWVKSVFWTNMLETAGLNQAGNTSAQRVMFLERNEENLSLIIPQEFEQLPPQAVNLMYKVPCHMRIGGIRVSYPKSIVAFDGTAG